MANRLAAATSPYLLQHAHNPVDWYEWGPEVAAAMSRATSVGASSQPLTESLLAQAVQAYGRAFDPVWGGFSPAPKFPQPMGIELLLRCHLRGRPDALPMAVTTLDRMAA